MKKPGPSIKKAEEVRISSGIGTTTKLKEIRIKYGLSQTALSKKSGIPLKTIQKYETADRLIDGAKLDTLCKLSLALDCKITDILEDIELIIKFNKVK